MSKDALRPCVDCHQLTRGNRCTLHAREYERIRVARRGDRYNAEHRRRAREVIAAEPWCHWPGCGRTDDLTADHIPSGYQVLCRGHNTARAQLGRPR